MRPEPGAPSPPGPSISPSPPARRRRSPRAATARRQARFKKQLFQGEDGKRILDALRLAHAEPPSARGWAALCGLLRRGAFAAVLAVVALPLLVSVGMVAYGPVCKPGPARVGGLS